MMWATCSTSTANWIALRQFRSACTTTLATFRFTNTSPGAMSMIWFAGTRESEQPIQRYFGACSSERRRKYSGSCSTWAVAQARLRSSRCERSATFGLQPDADVLGLREEAQRFDAAFAPHA